MQNPILRLIPFSHYYNTLSFPIAYPSQLYKYTLSIKILPLTCSSIHWVYISSVLCMTGSLQHQAGLSRILSNTGTYFANVTLWFCRGVKEAIWEHVNTRPLAMIAWTSLREGLTCMHVNNRIFTSISVQIFSHHVQIILMGWYSRLPLPHSPL